MEKVFRIGSSLPVPSDAYKTVINWPWKDMKVGEHVVIGDYDLIPKARGAAYSYARVTKKKFVIRKRGSDLVVWRVA